MSVDRDEHLRLTATIVQLGDAMERLDATLAEFLTLWQAEIDRRTEIEQRHEQKDESK